MAEVCEVYEDVSEQSSRNLTDSSSRCAALCFSADRIKRINGANTGISTAVTLMISTGSGGALLPGMLTVAAGMSASWVLYAKYDTLHEAHVIASKAFGVRLPREVPL